MAAYIALRDRRLRGGVPARPGLSIVNTDGGTPLGSAFAAINGASRASGGIHAMFVLCHGYAGSNERARMCIDAGGMGLQLGKEDVLHANVSMWMAICNRVQHIIVYSCAAANTEPGNEGTRADGRHLMGALALHTNAHVYAADRIQWYRTHSGQATSRFEFGQWEGQLLMFPPDGGSPSAVMAPPVEFSDL